MRKTTQIGKEPVAVYCTILVVSGRKLTHVREGKRRERRRGPE